MEQCTPKAGIEIVHTHLQDSFLIIKSKRAFRKKVKSASFDGIIRLLYSKFSGSGVVSYASHVSRQRPRRYDGSVAIVGTSVEKPPPKSSVRHSQKLGIVRTTLRCLIRIDLKMFPYKWFKN